MIFNKYNRCRYTIDTKVFMFLCPYICGACLVAQTGKNLTAMQETKFNPWVGKIPCRKEWLSTPVYLPGEFHEQRSLAGYSPWGCKELDTNERQTLSLSIYMHVHKHTFAIFWFWWYINGYAVEDPWGREIHKYLRGNEALCIANVTESK